MNPEIPLLEAKLEQLRKNLDMALMKGDYIAANKNEILVNQCQEKLIEAKEMNAKSNGDKV